MAELALPSSRSQGLGAGRIFTWLTGIASFALLAYLLTNVAYQMIVPPPAHRLVFVQDIPLPSGLGAGSPGQKDPLAPGVEQQFDKFDFQAFDPQTHRLFIAHTGANPDLLTLAHIKFDIKTDGHIVVFDTWQDRLIARIPIPQVAGMVDAPDLHKVYAADAEENIIYSIDVHTLKPTPIQLDDLESPDAVGYDPVEHKIFVSDVGAPADPKKTLNPDRNNQNVVVIDALSDTVITKINIGNLPKLPGEQAPTTQPNNVPTFGYDVGHNKYDEVQHRVFVTTQILHDADDPNPFALPPPGTGELVSIDALTDKIVDRLQLPVTCSTPHGLALDTQQEIAFIACTDFDTDRNLVQNLVRVDLKSMRVIPADPTKMRLEAGPDIILIDHRLHVLFVACKAGISVFAEQAGAFHKLGDYVLGKGTHTIAMDEETQYIYLPLNVGGRPTLRIAKYNPNGI
jgi:hypothetical protein